MVGAGAGEAGGQQARREGPGRAEGAEQCKAGGGRGREEGGGEADSSPPTMPTSSEPGHVAPREGACRCDELRALGMGRASWILSGPDATRGPYEGKAGETRPGRPRDDGSSLG